MGKMWVRGKWLGLTLGQSAVNISAAALFALAVPIGHIWSTLRKKKVKEGKC